MDEKIQLKCLTLAKLLLKEGTASDRTDMVVALVKRAFKGRDPIDQTRKVYDWLTKNKVDGAWEASGMGALVTKSV